ncbi:MAG: FAD-dependent oxidoreductase [Bacteroidales bacterium]
MNKITSHPILPIPEEDLVEFEYEGHQIKGQKGLTIAAALHQAGYKVHSHSLDGRKRTLECGIGKCGACEMLVDGKVKRICITPVDGVKKVEQIKRDNGFNSKPNSETPKQDSRKIYKTSVAIIGAGPSGLAVREELNKAGIDNIVIDNNNHIGGQFLMQTHQFFFFEKEKRFGGMRGFDIADNLAGKDISNIFLNSTVWDIFEGNRLVVKNILTDEIYYVEAQELVCAAGAIPFMPAFKNDDVPGVYSAAVVQRMMNTQFTLLGKNILTVGAGNIGYLTSYQAMQAGANIKAIIEAMPHEGGFPVQANRVRRLGIPIMTGYTLLEAIPNDDFTGITGAIIAKCENFKPIPGTEKRIDGIDCINICTGLLPDNSLLVKGKSVFGRHCHGVGDNVRIGEGTSAVLRGKQCAYEIMENLGIKYNYSEYLQISKDYIDSQQKPIRILDKPELPSKERMNEKGFVIIDCLYGFACNPCSFSCPQGAITKPSTSSTPTVDYNKCIGCMECVNHCPGLAIFGFNPKKNWVFLPIEYKIDENTKVFLVDNNGKKIGEGIIEKINKKPNKTNVARVKVEKLYDSIKFTDIRGFISIDKYPDPIKMEDTKDENVDTYICHCEDVTLQEILDAVGDRTTISASELKHITRLGMGACRGKRCLPRAKSALASYGIKLTGELTPRGPMANLVELENMNNESGKEIVITPKKSTTIHKQKVGAIVAGGGMAGSSTFRYLAEAGKRPILINKDRGSSWRNIAGGRPGFSVPALAEIATNNHEIFKELQSISNINLRTIRYVSFAHNQSTYDALEASKAWSKTYAIEPKDFRKEISEYFNPNIKQYSHAFITEDCWQATPGLTVDLVRNLGIKAGGQLLEQHELIEVHKENETYKVLVKDSKNQYIEYTTDIFVNALGSNASKFAKMLGYETGLYPIRHQAFITKRLPLIGKNGNPLDMLIDRRNFKGFSAVYGQQLAETGQIIGCASPAVDSQQASKDIKLNTKEYVEIFSEVFTEWIPTLKNVGFQALWSGYYTEPRYIVDPKRGLFVGMRGHGFMLSQYIGKLYVDSLLGKKVPDFFQSLSLDGNWKGEQAFK